MSFANDIISDLIESDKAVPENKDNSDKSQVNVDLKSENKELETTDNSNKPKEVLDKVGPKSDNDKVPEKPILDKDEGKKKYTKEEQTNYAFQKLKERKNREIVRLQKEIDDLKHVNLENKPKESFASPEEYQEYLVEKGVAKHLIKDKEQQMLANNSDISLEEADIEGTKKIESCFPDEAERNKYFDRYEEASSKKEWKLGNGKTVNCSFLDIITQELPSDILSAEKKDFTLVNHIIASEIGPKFLDYLFNNKAEVGKIFSMKDPLDKKLYLRDLEAKIKSEGTVKNKIKFSRTEDKKDEFKIGGPKIVYGKSDNSLKPVPKLGSQSPSPKVSKNLSSSSIIDALKYVRQFK